MKKIKIEFTNERIIPASGLAVVGAIFGKSDFVKRCNRMDVTPNRSQHQIKNGDVLLTYIGLASSRNSFSSFKRRISLSCSLTRFLSSISSSLSDKAFLGV